MVEISLYEKVCNLCHEQEKAGEAPSVEGIRREMHQVQREVGNSEWQLLFEYWQKRKARFEQMIEFRKKVLPIVDGTVEISKSELVDLVSRANEMIRSLTFELDAWVKSTEFFRDNCINMGGLSEFVPMTKAEWDELNVLTKKRELNMMPIM